jgi:hypothetical protein
VSASTPAVVPQPDAPAWVGGAVALVLVDLPTGALRSTVSLIESIRSCRVTDR